jgi:P pilus assembly chaperone PapD
MELQRRHLHAIVRLHPERALTIALAALLAIGLATGPAAAQMTVEVSPLRVELSVAPGGSHTQAVSLTNQGDSPVRIRATVEDWYLSKDGTPQYQPAKPGTWTTASAWVRVAPPEQVVAPGQQAMVRFTTTVPAGTTDGGYRSAVLFEFGPPGGDPVARGRDVQFRSRVATTVYVTVGQPAPKVELTNLTARAVAGRPPEVVATLQNASRANVRTKGVLTVYDKAGTVVRQIDVPNAPVLPESERDLAIPTAGEREPPLAPGEYRVEVKIDVGLRELLVGETVLKVGR